jgi:hypothetical protein
MAEPRFPPVQGGPARPGPAKQKSGKIPLLPIVLLVIYGIYIAVLIVAPAFSSDFEATLDGFFPPNFRVIVGGILLGAFALILVINLLDTGSRGPSRPVPAGPGGEVKKFKPVQPAQARAMPPSAPPQAARKEPPPPQPAPHIPAPKKQIIAYPSEVEGGIYGETYIELGQQKVLKLRSLVVEAEYLN